MLHVCSCLSTSHVGAMYCDYNFKNAFHAVCTPAVLRNSGENFKRHLPVSIYYDNVHRVLLLS